MAKTYLTREEIAEAEDLIRKIEIGIEATNKFTAKLEDPEFSLEIRALGMEMSDACDNLRESFMAIEETFRDQKLRPGWVWTAPDESIIWDGKNLVYDKGNGYNPLNSTSRLCRVLAANRMEALYNELTREREPAPNDKSLYIWKDHRPKPVLKAKKS
ncbi:MAG TPA: hypothetical protein VIE65_04260 [Methylobacter sp.]|jgi:hypothetical protein